MKYLLDTNALIFSLCNPSGLSSTATKIITTEKDLSVSIVSLWEIAIKQAIGKLNIKSTIPEIEKICKERDIEILAISSDELEGVKNLSPVHKDPFDRLIVSQAQKRNCIIITSDKIIPEYDVETIW